jgi:hypothetical protein
VTGSVRCRNTPAYRGVGGPIFDGAARAPEQQQLGRHKVQMSLRCAWRAMIALLVAAFSVPVPAASVSYVLDQSNADSALPDGTPYLLVTIADGAAGAIDFTVSILPLLQAIAGNHFGMQSFGFNTMGAADTMTAANVTGLPAGWDVSTNKSQNGFGKFEFVLGDAPGGGNVRIAPVLTFSITGISGDSIQDYVALSTGGVTQGPVYYAAHVAGFIGANNLLPPSAFFGGSRRVGANVVPLPATVWLLGSALGLLGSVRYRRLRQPAR